MHTDSLHGTIINALYRNSTQTILFQGQLYRLADTPDIVLAATAHDSHHIKPSSDLFWVYVGLCIFLVLFAGMMSGLSVGLFSIDPLKLELLRAGNDPVLLSQVQKLSPILKKHHLLLCTLLLSNSAAMEALPLFLDRLVPSYIAIILSVTLVLIFGEILPQALCTKDPVAIGARFAFIVRFLMVILYPIVWPMSKLLDYLLGHGDARKILFKPSELKGLLELHGDPGAGPLALSADQVVILKGTLDLRLKKVKDALTPISDVFMLNRKCALDFATMSKIMASGYSRIPVFEESRHNIVGMVLVKRLIVVDPEDERPLDQIHLRKPIVVSPGLALFDVLNRFQDGKSHLAVVTDHVDEYRASFTSDAPLPAYCKVLGVITIEDVMEEMIQEEIEDELDVSIASKAIQKIITKKVGVDRAVRKFKKVLENARRRKESSKKVRLRTFTPSSSEHYELMENVESIPLMDSE